MGNGGGWFITHGMVTMKKFRGISASPGIAIGRIFLYLDEKLKVPRYDILPDDLENEIDRFKQASSRAVEEIKALQKEATEQELGEESRFLDSHILMLSDPEFISRIELNLKNYLKNVEWILYLTVKQVVKKLEAADSPYLRERTVDIHDVAKRVLSHLMFNERISLSDLQNDVIVVCHDLLPSDTIGMKREKVKGIAMNAGGKTSHTAILARAFQIPAVLGLSDITNHARSGERIIIDGDKGTVILDPDEATLAEYRGLLNEWYQHEKVLNLQNKLSCVTKDKKHIHLYANIEVPEEVESVIDHHADGIGLYRSEFLFLQSDGEASEERQFQAYSSVLKAMEGHGSVTIRTLDVGGDKLIPDISSIGEKNPILGWRSVRFCMGRKDIFKTQLRALLRASVFGKLRIMFPMISGADELDAILGVLEEVKEELMKENISFDASIPVGIMIEVPSAAVTSDLLSRKVDFFSIGTNDLIQYTIAVDRGNEKVAYLYEPFHPAVLRMIKMVIDNAKAADIPVSLCGELAGEPKAAALLLGLGLENYSMSSTSLPEIKKIIRSITVKEAEELSAAVLEMDSARIINAEITKWMENKFGK